MQKDECQKRLAELSKHPDSRVRRAIVESSTSAEELFGFSCDSSLEVLVALTKNKKTPQVIIEDLLKHEDDDVVIAAIATGRIMTETLEELLKKDVSWTILVAIIECETTSSLMIEKLLSCPTYSTKVKEKLTEVAIDKDKLPVKSMIDIFLRGSIFMRSTADTTICTNMFKALQEYIEDNDSEKLIKALREIFKLD